MLRKSLAAAVAAMALGCAFSSSADALTLKVYGTTDVTDSNLLAGLIAPAYLAATGNTINYVAQGTGAALDSAAIPANNADAVMVHSPPLEAAWVAAGHSVEPLGRAIFYNGYYLVGPTTDPAGVVAAGHTHNAIAAMQDIAASGALSNSRFNSRDNASGTNVQEQVNWGLTSGVPIQQAWNNAGDTTRFTPWDTTNTHPPHNFPTWYVSTNQGQGANLTTTNNCSPVNCYTMVDSGTWKFVSASLSPLRLKVVNLDNTGGSNTGLQTNPFHAYAVSTAPNSAAAIGFLNFLTSDTFQHSSLKNFPSGSSSPAATPDAFASITANTLPDSAGVGAPLAFTATLKYAPPVAVPINGMPVQLQHQINGGSWTNVGTTHNTSASGVVSLSATANATPATECFRLSMGTYDDGSAGVASRFSPNTNSALGPFGDGCVEVS